MTSVFRELNADFQKQIFGRRNAYDAQHWMSEALFWLMWTITSTNESRNFSSIEI